MWGSCCEALTSEVGGMSEGVFSCGMSSGIIGGSLLACCGNCLVDPPFGGPTACMSPTLYGSRMMPSVWFMHDAVLTEAPQELLVPI